VTTYQVVIGFVAAEPIETFTPARLTNISILVAAESGVDPSAVTTVAYAASTRVEITIVTTDSSASAAVEEILSTSVFADADAASEFLSLQVTNAPTIAVETVTRLVAPEITSENTAGLSVPADASSNILIFIIAVAAGILAILCGCFFRYRGKGKGRSLARGRAQIGLGGASTGSSSPRGPSTEMEDFSVRKGDKPSEPSAASQGTIDIDKISVSAKKNNPVASSNASATPRGAAKIAALNDMVEQASRASKIKLIPWNELEMAEKLGEGTFGTVHACSFKATPCAVKQLREDKESSVQLLADMLREHDAMMGLRHPNVVLMLGIATDHVQRVGIVLELLEISLLELLHGTAEYKEYRTWRASLLSIASDVAKGVAYLHFNNVLHRDLKPGNVLLSDSWVAKVADFGSSANGKPGSAAEGEGIHGTPPYISPEVARGENNQTAAVDVWSFGCLLVHMGTLSPPYFALKCKHAMDIVRVVQRGEISPVQVLLDDAERREFRCPAGIVALAKQCCHREPTQRPDMPAIAGALASPAIQSSILKGAKDARPLVRLQRSRASVEGERTFDASKGTYDASVAASSARGGYATPSPRSSPAHNASKAKFRNLSKHAPAGASSTRGEPSARSAASVGSAFESTFDGKAEKSVESTSNRTFDGKEEAKLAAFNRTFDGKEEAKLTAFNRTFDGKEEAKLAAFNRTFDGKEEAKLTAFNQTFDGKEEAKLAAFNRTFDGKAEASTTTANKTSIALTANLARASMSNLNAGNKSQRGSLEHATESARYAHDGADRRPLTSERLASTVGSTAARLPSTSQPVGVNVHKATSQQTTTRHASSPAGGASHKDSSSSTAGAAKPPVGSCGGAVRPSAAMSPVGGGCGGAVRPSAQSAASASAAAPSSAATKSAAAPLGSPAAERTMAQKVARVKEELSLDPSLPVAKAVAEANAAMGIEGQGTLAQQVDLLLTELGVLC
jgi:serine/threonine protein kinase